jgi:cytochrome b involved in lipid metabolism
MVVSISLQRDDSFRLSTHNSSSGTFKDDLLSLAETASDASSHVDADNVMFAHERDESSCDACSLCNDVCLMVEACHVCCNKVQPCTPGAPFSSSSNSSFCARKHAKEMCFTRCQIRRHNHADSAWIIADNMVYDVTRYVRNHPGGAESILRKTGGSQDCAMDMQFHGKSGRDAWKKCRIGKLVECGHERTTTRQTTWWSLFW